MSGVLGADPGTETGLDSTDFSNTFATIPDQSIDSVADRVIPRQVQSGVTRGAQVVVGASGVPQVLSGNQSTFGEGFYVSKPNIDVTANTDPAQLIFNSNQNMLKIVQTGIATIPAVPGASQRSQVTVFHNLGFVPAVIAYVNFPSQSLQLPYIDPGSVATAGNINFLIDVLKITTTQIIFESLAYSGGSSGLNALPIKYYLMQETASAT